MCQKCLNRDSGDYIIAKITLGNLFVSLGINGGSGGGGSSGNSGSGSVIDDDDIDCTY